MKNKPKIGIYGITGCMGCQLNILYQPELLEFLQLVDLKSFPVGKEHNCEEGGFDIIFVEGVVVREKERNQLRELRKKTKMLVAIGACATDGCVPAIKNFMNRNLDKSVMQWKELVEYSEVDPQPIDDTIMVDAYIRGCPMDRVEFFQFLKQVLAGKAFRPYEKPVCFECNLRERGCLLEEGIECLGPVTFGNCSVMCPEKNYPCVGCRGPYSQANFEAFFKLLKSKGVSKKVAQSHLNRFAGVKFERMMKGEDVGLPVVQDSTCKV